MYRYIERFCFEWNNQTLYPSGTNASCHLVAGIFPNEIQWVNKTTSTSSSSASSSESNSTSTTSTSRSFICSSHNDIYNLILRYLRCRFVTFNLKKTNICQSITCFKFVHSSISFAVSPENFGGHFKNGSWTGMLSLFEHKVGFQLFKNKKKCFHNLQFLYLESRFCVAYIQCFGRSI